MDWIAVESKLPPQNTPVLVFIGAEDNDHQKFSNMQVAYLSAKQWIGKDTGLAKVSHWLPLPPPPAPPVDEHFEAIKFASDSVTSLHVPADKTAQDFSFDIIVEKVSYTVTYQKGADGYWDFVSYK